MAKQPAPRALDKEIYGEIIHRLPPGNPASLFRASAVSRRGRAFVTDAHAIRRYREFHKAPPVLGLLQNRDHASDPSMPPEWQQPHLFTTATPPPPPINLPYVSDDLLLLDSRHGRVLILNIDPTVSTGLIRWNPITAALQDVPDVPMETPFNCFTAAVLCVTDGCHHLDCHGGPFRVIFAATIINAAVAIDEDEEEDDQHIDEDVTWACLYSSLTGDWTKPTTVDTGPLMDSFDQLMGPSLLAGDAVYFTLELLNNRAVLRYDLGGAALSVMNTPPQVSTRRDTFLVTGKDGGLGVAAVEGYRLCVWSWSEGVWAPWRDISVVTMVPFSIGLPINELKLIGFAEMSGVIFVMLNDDTVSTVELKSGKISEVVGDNFVSRIVFPLESFYTPAKSKDGDNVMREMDDA